jgi:hypothetical protein
VGGLFDDRAVVPAETLVGPRVYSTDLHASLLDLEAVEDSVETAVRALKVKLLTRGTVALNARHLVSPFGALVFRAQPELLLADGILPAVQTDKGSFGGYVSDQRPFEALGISGSELGDYLTQLDKGVRTIMPWELADTPQRYRQALVEGLRSETSAVTMRLAAAGVTATERERIAQEVEKLTLEQSAELEALINKLPGPQQLPVRRFAAAVYHQIGTAVVQCEAGTDLSPLSDFKAADLTLVGRDLSVLQLSDESIFFDMFLGHALDAIGSEVLPASLMSMIDIPTTVKLSSALRDQGFQQKYEELLTTFAENRGGGATTLEKIDPERIATVATDLANVFEDAVTREVLGYKTEARAEAEKEFIATSADVAKDAISQIPVVGHVIAVADIVKHTGHAAASGAKALSMRDHQQALADAKQKKLDKIEQAIVNLHLDEAKKKQLLAAAAALTEIAKAKIGRA